MIVIVSGLPGSGKSFFAEKLSKALGAEYISSDRIRKGLNASGLYTFSDKLAIYLAMAEKTRKAVKGNRTVVVDATFYHHTMRDYFKQLAEEETVPIYFILVKTTEQIAKKRLSEPRADSEADYGVYVSIKNQFEKYTFPHLTLFSTNDNIEEMLSKTTEQLSKRHERKADKSIGDRRIF
ncbi:ATP-binding protein [Dyadobacter sp. NIV53]|uniref:AAA family ATPase n=1 Tax=Dyadobacter sp. NIV53 TaxID=2861765 RepID=UPI001C86B30A|nr:ATP-binding protein [Dyadobacter sp. NIV53]